jgi:hypothetical protein
LLQKPFAFCTKPAFRSVSCSSSRGTGGLARHWSVLRKPAE